MVMLVNIMTKTKKHNNRDGHAYAIRLILILYSNFQIFVTVGWYETKMFVCAVRRSRKTVLFVQ